jgi:hypothetical protein
MSHRVLRRENPNESSFPPDYEESLVTPLASSASRVSNLQLPTEDLPDYSTGASVTKSRSGRKQVLSIQLDDPRKGGFFSSGDMISGTVTIRPGRDVTISAFLIDLQMVESVVRSEYARSARTMKTAILTKYEVPVTAYPENMTFRKGLQYSFGFSMQIPTHRPDTTCQSGQHTRWPPSIGGLPEDKVDDDLELTDLSCRVYYCVSSRIIVGGQEIEEQAYINVVPSHPFETPLTDLQFECKKEIKTGIIKKSVVGVASIQINKLPPIRLWNSDPTVFDLNLSFHAVGSASPPAVQTVVVAADIITGSSFLGVEITATDGPPVRTLTDRVRVEKIDVSCSSQWEQTGPGQYAQVIKVSVTPDRGDIQFVPSFESCLTERRYEVQFTIRFEGASLALKVPVKLVYEGGSAGGIMTK